ncbi:Transcriptional regulator [Limosilactobacillus gastricus PS3]|mgnify:FL=1|uniref:Transcriptional regulator CtsR n=2 Tax=Limosilactobacillus gastricus TaxID=227942 RepID=H4GKY7_9LACO|nr:CtsR family transcriptional regulator [Limosilactobacillus gastricus]EHS84839.1 Transcriptional regulator [Limosilactobacillus gastricus PS3]KRM02386.1 Transcriptional regulator [Limosilactobacillus gastricus DSM 16045]QGF39985.1 CtsR family transcriptional regulator [Limosilactobacillus gastricus]
MAEEKSMSDVIEQYLKSVLGDASQIEIRRSEIADHFDVVPSQINYVIKTRFTPQRGYFVESKRGGGGYIRIEKVSLLDGVDVLETLINGIGDLLTERDAAAVIKTLYQEQLITRREGDLMMTMISKQTLIIRDRYDQQRFRAHVMKMLLNRLRYES